MSIAKQFAEKLSRVLKTVDQQPEVETRTSYRQPGQPEQVEVYMVDTGYLPGDHSFIHGVLTGMGATWCSDGMSAANEHVVVSRYTSEGLVIRVHTEDPEGGDSDGSIVVFVE